MAESKKLYLSTKDKVFFGVCGGLADYFEIDPVLVRLVFVILAVWGGVGVAAYIIGAIIMSENPAEKGAKMKSKNDLGEKIESAAQQVKEDMSKNPSKGQWIGGLILITLGFLFLVNQFVPALDFGKLWPLVLIIMGAVVIANNTRR